jgi:hypothetical protein
MRHQFDRLKPLRVGATALGLLTGLASAAPLPSSQVPDPLKSWVPWVQHGQEMLACPVAHNGEGARACVWPSRLTLQVTTTGAQFSYEVQVLGGPMLVQLPGETGRWPQDVVAGKLALAVSVDGDRPATRLPAGTHLITGNLRWAQMPADLLLPAATGSLQITINGKPVQRVPDADGRVLLQATSADAQATDTLTLRISRLIEDDIPLRVTTHYDIALSGQAREIVLDAALLPGFVPESIESTLPARLGEAGQLRLQGRPGNWTVQVRGRVMAPVAALTLPAPQDEQIWSFAARNDLRVVALEGLSSVDPKQVPIPEAWRALPAYQIKAGQTLKINESRRGNPQPGADQLKLQRQIWLDFDGKGYTFKDTLSGKLSRSWRLEMAAPGVLGRAAADGADQPVTRRAGVQADGVELRRGALRLQADSRVEGAQRSLPASGWAADFNAASAQLHLPPGWRLLHARGVDKAEGSWLSRWTLWDFFFVLLAVLATAKLRGRVAALLMAGALVLGWHMDDAPQALWLVLLALLALHAVLPAGRLLTWATWGSRVCAAVLALWLVPYAVQQVRLSLHPVLEHSGIVMAEGETRSRDEEPSNAAVEVAAAPAPALMQDTQGEVDKDKSTRMGRVAKSARVQVAPAGASVSGKYDLADVDPTLKVQTGPGLPGWRWNRHALLWQGPVQSGQSLGLVLLPPAGTVLLRLGGLALMLATLWVLTAGLVGSPRWPRWPRLRRWPRSPAAAVGQTAAALLVATLFNWALPSNSAAATPLPPPAITTAAKELAGTNATAMGVTPDPAVLEELRNKLNPPPECLPNCASVSRLRVQAGGAQVQLRLEVHALADVMLPLPGQGASWRPNVVTADGRSAVLRRDDNGALWAWVRAGVTQLVLGADVGDATTVEIALPLPPRETSAQMDGWTLAGLDARGQSSGALSLSRLASGSKTSGADSGTQRDALPPFLRVERILHLGLRWTIETRISRISPSRAPARAKVKLLDGEAVNDAAVRVEDGHALVQLGVEDSASFVSTLKEAPQLQLTSGREAQQVEIWRLDPAALWHVGWSGIAPVVYEDKDSGRLMPSWQPWPGESVSVQVDKPAGTPGPTMTIDRVLLNIQPGLRATNASAQATLRSSQGGNHKLMLPEGVEFLGVSLDGQALPIQPQGRELRVPITPGEHRLKLDWREPRGMPWRFATVAPNLGAAGVNATTQITAPIDRVVLAVGGPQVGPAVLLWGVLAVLLLVAFGLARSGLVPLGVGAWFLLGVGLAQSSLAAAAVVVGWFVVLAARRRWVGRADPMTNTMNSTVTDTTTDTTTDSRSVARMAGHLPNLVQVLLVVWTLLAAALLLNAVRVGLLGYPDMMVTGNGSDASVLRWYQDRFADQPASAWVVSVPVLAYRLLMLLWALWLAASMLKWVKWAWECFSAGGYWHRRPAKTVAMGPPPSADEPAADNT